MNNINDYQNCLATDQEYVTLYRGHRMGNDQVSGSRASKLIKFFKSLVHKPLGANRIRISGYTSMRGYMDPIYARDDAIYYMNH